MHKKLTKYIESYEMIQDTITYDLLPNGGMIVLINQKKTCEVMIENSSYKLKSSQILLINAYETSVNIKSEDDLNLIAIRFRGAGASFFYDDYMEELMYNPNEPIYLKENIIENEFDSYLQSRFKPSTLPFNIMKIIDLLDIQKSDYSIDEVLAVANVPRKILDKLFRLKVGMTFKTYANIKEQFN